MKARCFVPLIAACLVALVSHPSDAADERTVWKYEKGTFEKQADGKWVHKTGKKTHEYTEKRVTDDFIEIEDKARKAIVRMDKDSASLRIVGGKPQDGERWKGAWAGAATEKDPDPKAKVDGKFTEVSAFKRDGQQGVYALVPSPDGKQVALQHGPFGNPQFGILNAATGKPEKGGKLPGTVNNAAWSADGKTVAGAMFGKAGKDGTPSKVIAWDAATWEPRAEFEIPGLPVSFATSADGNVVAAASSGEEGVLKVWDVGAKKEVYSAKPAKIALTADGKVLARTGPMPNQVTLYDLPGGKARGTIPCRPDFILSADGSTLVDWVYGADGLVISVWSTKAGAKGPQVIKAGKWKADQVIFLDKDRHIAVGGGMTQDEVRVFELKTLKEVDSFKVGKMQKGGGRSYLVIRATPDSAHLLTYGSDHFVRVWATPFGEKKGEAPTPKEKE